MTSNDSSLSPEGILQAGPILLYDGECGVCNRSVQWILEHERADTLRFAALESDVGRSLTAAGQVPSDIDSVLWVERADGAVHVKKWSSSVLEVVRYVGGPWRLLGIFRLVPRPVRDFAYRFFAKHRQKVAPRACLLPPPQTRARFVGTLSAGTPA